MQIDRDALARQVQTLRAVVANLTMDLGRVSSRRRGLVRQQLLTAQGQLERALFLRAVVSPDGPRPSQLTIATE